MANKVQVKRDRKGYRISTGVISIVMGCLLLSAYGNSNSDDFFIFGAPGLLTLISGICQLQANNSKKKYLTSGILLLVGAGLNFIGNLDISIYAIYAVIVGIFDIIFSKEKD